MDGETKSRWRRLFIEGPDPEIAAWLPWWGRLLLVGALIVVGAIWDGLPLFKQLTWGLQYAAIIGVSLVASLWAIVLGINVLLGGSWLYVSWQPPIPAKELAPADGTQKPRTTPLSLITSANRHWGHIEALATWTVIAFVAYPALAVQLPGVVALFLLGPPLVNGFTRFVTPVAQRPEPSKAAGDLQLERRVWIYVATIAGLIILTLRAWDQRAKLAPLYLMLAGGLALRFWRFGLRKLQEKRGGDHVREARRAIVKGRSGPSSTAKDVVFGPGLIVLGVAAIAVWSYVERNRVGEIIQNRLNGPATAADRCVPEAGGPVKPSFEMLILADTQLHELGGTRFPGQLGIADTFVSVAIRPVELDMLAGAIVRNVGDTFNAFAAEKKSSPLWAHLGDFADLSCKGEMDRTLKLLKNFGGRLAGVAPGNHDRAFTGNFYWSPFWDTACRSSRLEKEDSDGKILAALGERLAPGGRMEPIQRWSWRTGFAETPSALVSVSRLGVVKHLGAEHAVLGIFIDTSDRHASDFGIAGVNGTFSERQADTIRKLVADAKAQDADPLFILFGHHPYSELTWRSHGRLQTLICELDGDASCGEDRNESTKPPIRRVLAMVSAHTHHAQRLRHCVGGRVVRELIVGSTLDPPQEAAWLAAGTDIHGRAAVRLQSLPVVGRPELTCDDDDAARPAFPTAARCRSVVAALAADAHCRELFARPGEPGTAGPPCAELERPLSFQAKLQGLQTYAGPSRPAKIMELQERRAKTLLSCVCRAGDCKVPEHPFDNEAYEDELMVRAQSLTGREELACLAWAASAVQAHKAAGMQMSDALRCAFDDPTIHAALDSVAVLEDVACE